ncbi:transglutaminase family protein [Aquimarina sediminis]|uniref:transglutaminase family protein n=1 Tax=Aquimarina sediminis TaxID=2070536 RepID=UPI000C9FFC36|nr:transglutaminase-like domain-containing protein [Aquimarina sediminis]
MKTLDHSSIKALISLLEDPSEIIFKEINQTIIALGEDGITHLQTAFDESNNNLQKERIAKILDILKLQNLEKDLVDWKDFNRTNLLNGLLHIAKYGYPNLRVADVDRIINDIATVLKEQIEGKTNLEIAHALNQVVLYDFGFNGNIRDYSGINNSFINKVVENKIGNPIGLSIIYLLVAEKLNIPLIGINSPGHFILGFVSSDYNTKKDTDLSIMDHIDFYIDPFNNGRILNDIDFNSMLKMANYNPSDKSNLAATKLDIIKRVMNNLIYALFTTGEKRTAQELLEINDIL